MNARDDIYETARSVIDGELGILVNQSDIENTADSLSYALISAGYVKPRTVSSVEDLETLFNSNSNVILMDEDGVVLQNLAGGWATPISTRFMTSETVHRAFGPDFTVLHEGGAA